MPDILPNLVDGLAITTEFGPSCEYSCVILLLGKRSLRDDSFFWKFLAMAIVHKLEFVNRHGLLEDWFRLLLNKLLHKHKRSCDYWQKL